MEVGIRELVGDVLTSMLVEVASLRSGTVNKHKIVGQNVINFNIYICVQSEEGVHDHKKVINFNI